jgi:hypothetical protein
VRGPVEWKERAVPESDRHRLLAIYLNDHLAGSTAGVDLISRLAKTHRHGDAADRLSRLATEIREDRNTLLAVLERLDVRPDRRKIAVGWVGEKVGRLKLNGRLLRRSPLSSVTEVETMMLGVRGKAAVWRTLHTVAEHEPRLDGDEFTRLIARADEQIDTLESIRVAAVAAVLRPGDPRAQAQVDG